MYIEKVSIINIRCIGNAKISFDLSGDSPPWTTILGDNSTGKTTVLRSIAIGLCDESSAAALLKESDSGYVRHGQEKKRHGEIKIDLLKDGQRFTIKTTIEHRDLENGGYVERVRQDTDPEEFPWDELFVTGYGAGRGTSGAGDISGYSVINAVYNMFNYTEGLQNPELTIRRLADSRAKSSITNRDIFRAIENFTGTQGIRLTRRGILIDGPWGDGMPLRDLADGYKSAFAWLADMIGWALAFKPTIRGTQGIRGIVLIDEIEQHLHA